MQKLTRHRLHNQTKSTHFFRVWGVWGEARTQILVWFIGLMACSATVTILAVQRTLITRLEEQFQQSLKQEIEEFRQLTKGKNPETGQLFQEDVASVFKVFLNRNIPDDGQFLIALLNGQVYRSSPRALPEIFKDADFVDTLAQLTQSRQGQVVYFGNETLLYSAEPVLRGKSHGVFVVAYLTAGERNEVDDAVAIVTKTMLAVLGFVSLLAWIVAGRILAPLRLLARTARSVSESDLTQRLPVRGNGELAELAITFNEMMDRLQAAFDSQRNLLNDAGHELRTPITIVRGHLELMGDTPEEKQTTRELVLDELDRMNRLVNDLILLAKAERPDFLQLETVSLKTFTEELYTKISALAERNWQLEACGRGQIVIDRQRLTQAVMNLAQNAAQHTQTGDTVALGSSLKETLICFWLRDSGEGILPTDQKRIFQRFARGKNNRHSEGTGLGLSIVQAIVEAHDGWIQLNSEPGLGSTFTLWIPLEPLQENL